MAYEYEAIAVYKLMHGYEFIIQTNISYVATYNYTLDFICNMNILLLYKFASLTNSLKVTY